MTVAADIIVTHKRQPVPVGYTGVYIGRPSPLGNPYVIGRGRNREQVIELFGVHLLEAICGDTPEARALARLVDEVRSGRNIALQCWCAPLPCHGDVIRAEVMRQTEAHP